MAVAPQTNKDKPDELEELTLKVSAAYVATLKKISECNVRTNKALMYIEQQEKRYGINAGKR